jgi:hypothetical protein
MQIFLSRITQLVMALFGVVAVSAVPASSSSSLSFTATGAGVTGSGQAVFDATGAPSVDPYVFRPGDTFHASFDLGAVTVNFTELDGTASVLFLSSSPADLMYHGFQSDGVDNHLGAIADLTLDLFGEGGFQIRIHYDDGEEGTTHGQYSVTFDPPTTTVPEPASALMLGAGLAAIAWRRRRA